MNALLSNCNEHSCGRETNLLQLRRVYLPTSTTLRESIREKNVIILWVFQSRHTGSNYSFCPPGGPFVIKKGALKSSKV